MKRKITTLKLFTLMFCTWICSTQYSTAQLNMTQIGYLDLVSQHNSDCSDIWGYVDQSGNEYAIVGMNDGTSVVDLSDPSNPVEVFYEPGMNSVWRDIKTYGDYAYVTTEANNGLLIIDLSTLPGNTNLQTYYYYGPSGNQWSAAHNLYIDENGRCYIFGADRGNGGVIMLDLTANPTNPPEIGVYDDFYVHDGVARGDTLYNFHISDGFFSIVDVSTPSNPVVLGSSPTSSFFSHNGWISDDGNYVYTTDELSDAYIDAYDISDPTDIKFLDKIQSSPGDEVIPHNTHFINEYLVTSYYRDGVTIHDVSRPGNMVEVGNFDSSPLSGDGFNGCWGAYPWLPSGNIIISDIENGLYVLGATYQRGCYLEGVISDANTTAPLQNAQAEIVGTSFMDLSDLSGEYATGIAQSGSYDVIYSKSGYLPDTITVTLSNGVVTTQNVALTPLPSFEAVGEVISSSNGFPIPFADVRITNLDWDYQIQADANGEFTIDPFYNGTYTASAGAWGYKTDCSMQVQVDSINNQIIIELDPGYYDDFTWDFGWTVSGFAQTGVWERGEPVGTSSGPWLINPEDDVSSDCFDLCFVTGNGGGTSGTDDVDGANTVLTSPTMDLTGYSDPFIHYQRWWVNAGGSGTPNDTLHIRISDGTNTVTVESLTDAYDPEGVWVDTMIRVSDHITPGATMQLILETADWNNNGGHLVEAAVDEFYVTEGNSVPEYVMVDALQMWPNPTTGEFKVEVPEGTEQIKVFDLGGREVMKMAVNSNVVTMSTDIQPGIYMVVAQTNKRVLANGKLIITE